LIGERLRDCTFKRFDGIGTAIPFQWHAMAQRMFDYFALLWPVNRANRFDDTIAACYALRVNA
jgi:hypothetical protein